MRHCFGPLMLAIVLLVGCRKTFNAGGGYTISAPASPDGQHHGNTLEFNGKRVCDNVGLQQVHDELIVFAGYVEEGALDDQQLFVSKGAGPRVLISLGVVDRAGSVKDPFNGKGSSLARVENLSPLPDGVRVQFFVDQPARGPAVYETHDLSWGQLQALYDRGQSAALVKCKSGDYRLLLPAPTTQTTNPAAVRRARKGKIRKTAAFRSFLAKSAYS